jgi:chemotaxis protein MotA
VIGIVIALGALIGGTLIEGGSPAAYANVSALLIILGGTFGATIASFSMAEFLRFPKLLGLAVKARPSHTAELRDQLVVFAERARREGLLALESDVDRVEDAFMRKGLQMVIDGLEPEIVEEILELDTEALQRRHAGGAALFTAMGGYAPTMGVIGTVMGLVSVLSQLDDPGNLGTSIAVAFIATLIGVGSANILWLPVGNALKVHSAQEVAERRLATVGILAIQAGDNPRIVAQKLDSLWVHPQATAVGSGATAPGGEGFAQLAEEAA